MDKGQRRPKRNEHLVINDSANTPSLLDPVSGRIILTNLVGKRVIELVDGRRTVAEIVVDVSARFPGVDASTIGRDVDAFLDDAAAKGLTTWPET